MSSFLEAEARGRKGLSTPAPPATPRETVSRSREYWDALFAHYRLPWEGDDEDAVRFRHNERQADRDEREAYDNWSYFHGAGSGPVDFE